MTGRTTSNRACDRCGQHIVAGEGGWISTGKFDDAHQHVSCIGAAYFRGRRDGYKDTVRQVRDATRAIKEAKRA